MTQIEKQMLLQRINNEINQFKAKISSIIENDTKDDFLSSLEDDIGKTPFEGVFPNKPNKDITAIQQELYNQFKQQQNNTSSVFPSDNGTAPLESAVPEYLRKNFEYTNNYIVSQTLKLLEIVNNNLTKETINTAYFITVIKTVLFNNFRNNKIPKFGNKDITICLYEKNKLGISLSSSNEIDEMWLQAAIFKYCNTMTYHIERIIITTPKNINGYVNSNK